MYWLVTFKCYHSVSVFIFFWCLYANINSLTNPFLYLQNSRVHILDTESFDITFGPKAQRKKPVLATDDMKNLLEQAEASALSYNADNDKDRVTEDTGVRYMPNI